MQHHFGMNFYRLSICLPTLPNDLTSVLITTFLGHPFGKEKKHLWNHFVRAFFWMTWQERNKMILKNEELPFNRFFLCYSFIGYYFGVNCPLFSISIAWTHFSPIGEVFCNSLSLHALLSNWHVFAFFLIIGVCILEQFCIFTSINKKFVSFFKIATQIFYLSEDIT